MSLNLLSHFRFGQTWSETKTLQIFLKSFCVNSPAHASFYFSKGSSPCLHSLTSLEPTFLHCGVHPFLLMLPLRSSLSLSLSLAKVRLSLTFTLSPFTTWCSGQTASFLFILVRAAPAFLPTALCDTQAFSCPSSHSSPSPDEQHRSS